MYSGVVGQLFIATLYVKDGAGNEVQDNYYVKIYESTDLSIPAHLDVRINMATDKGLWWLHTTMIRGNYAGGSPGYGQPYGWWNSNGGADYDLPGTATSVDAFQLHGSLPNKDYDSDPYVETVQRGLNHLLYNTHAYTISGQAHGNPDTNSNGIGLVTNYSSDLGNTRQTYIGGICLTTLASSGAPSIVASVGRANVIGRTYGDIVQDMVDFFAWGQVDSGAGRGGWRYHANYGDADMSTAQWPPLGMLAAENNMGSTVPLFVRDELIYFLDYTQHTALDNNNGGFGYSNPSDHINVTKAAAGIICHEFLHLTPSVTTAEAEAKEAALLADPKVQMAIGFIYRHWNDNGGSWIYQPVHGNSYVMYGVMKAFRNPQPDISRVTEYDYDTGVQTANSFDWYYTPTGQTNPQGSAQGLASHCVATQQSNGSWDDTTGPNPVWDAFSTGWRVLILLKGVTIIPPEAVICDCDEQEYNLNQDIQLDGSCSYHPDQNRSIISYEWDLDDDGQFNDAVGPIATIAGGFPAEGLYPVALLVTDDNPEGAQTDVYECEVWVHPPPHCPHAFADGPYIVWIGVPVTLDASASWDPDNEIVSYEWDLDNDGLFGADDGDCFGEPSDAVGINPEWTWYEPYFGVIGLRVTDAAGEFEACSDMDYSTVDIGNHPPVCDPGGPYTASADSTIVLDGTASYDPDPGDDITCAWDLDNDGKFDNSFVWQPEFPVGADIGTIYDICLKVTDNFGEYDIACTTVEVIPNTPPVAVCQGTVVAIGEDPNIDGGSWDPDVGDTITLSQSPSGAFAEAGIYEVTLTVTDSYGATDSCTAMVIVYDPTGGFVTGGGWINSPEGAYVFDPLLTGKANFGFVSKYKKGAKVPTGQTEFQFHAADLNFHSSSYEWLVVTGSNYARFKGTGTINGSGLYKFMLWAGDGEPDTFRIKIWTEDDLGNENIVYDNGSDQPIDSGSIVVHTKK